MASHDRVPRPPGRRAGHLRAVLERQLLCHGVHGCVHNGTREPPRPTLNTFERAGIGRRRQDGAGLGAECQPVSVQLLRAPRRRQLGALPSRRADRVHRYGCRAPKDSPPNERHANCACVRACANGTRAQRRATAPSTCGGSLPSPCGRWPRSPSPQPRYDAIGPCRRIHVADSKSRLNMHTTKMAGVLAPGSGERDVDGRRRSLAGRPKLHLCRGNQPHRPQYVS